MKRQHWQDLVNLALGLWVIVSPWTITHIMAGPQNPAGATDAAMWNHYIIGTAVAVLAGAALFAFAAWEEWTNVVLGICLLVSPWLLGFGTSAALMWNAVVIGTLVLGFAGWALWDDQSEPRLGGGT